MAHPHANVRQSKVEHSRVGSLTKGYASGGAVSPEKAVHAHEAKMHKGVPKTKFAMGGAVTGTRLDRPARAKGGRVGKGTNVNIVIAPQGGQAPMPGVAAGPPPVPVRPPMADPPMPPGPPPNMGPPPGMPIRSHGGRTYATGGAVKPGPAYEEGKRLGTKVQHAPGKDDQGDVNRPRVITYATGGPVEAPKGKKGMGPKFEGGGRGGLARLQKAARAKKAR